MNNQDDQRLNELYQNANQELPPEKLDDLILKHAKQSKPSNSQPKRRWQSWFAAASVLLVIPMIWLLTQNQHLIQSVDTTQPVPLPEPSVIPTNQQDNYANEAIDTSNAPKRTVVKSAAQPMPETTQADAGDSEISVIGEPINQQSLSANKKLLLDELKVKKRSLKPSNMTPLMALETTQFNKYIAEGDWQSAEQLLSDMEANWSDFDFSKMKEQLKALKNQ